MSFDKQLYAVLSHQISKALEKAPENVVYGTFDDDYKKDYLDFLKSIVNEQLPKVSQEYGADDVRQYIVSVVASLSNHKGWTYKNNLVEYIL